MIALNPQLQRVLKSAQHRFILAAAFWGIALASPLCAAAWLGGLMAPLEAVLATAALALGFAMIWCFAARRSWPTPERLLRHLDRSIPEMEDSASLLLADELPPLQAAQRHRILQRLEGIDATSTLPKGALLSARKKLAMGLGAVGIFLLLSPWIPKNLALEGMTQWRNALMDEGSNTQEPVEVRAWNIEIQAPAYTNLDAFTVTSPELKVPQDAKIHWRVVLSREVDALVVHHRPGESRDLGSGRQFEWDHLAGQPGYYYLEFKADGAQNLSTYYPIEMIEDQPPALTVMLPEETRSEIKKGTRSSFPIRLSATDDYGLAGGHMVVTVAKGSGENVKFRERNWPLNGWEQGVPRERELHATLDFAEWEMEWGDEVYFHITLWDNREPEPNQTRSDTYFLVLLGGDEPQSLDTEGILLKPVRAFFRSQRQIIIDTEKLLAQKDQISEAEFRLRSETLGVDQKVLRLRYGQFLGEEFETSIGLHENPVVEDDHSHHGGESHEEGHAGLPDEHDAEPQKGFVEQTTMVADNIRDILPAGLLHDHDSAEISTFFDPKLKAQLKEALGEMWESELYLRTIRPSESLPYQYRALKLIKEIQRLARVYDQRVGIETPPLQPEEKRLTGERKNMAKLGGSESLEAEDPYDQMRRAWRMLDEPNALLDQSLLNAALPKIEQAAREQPQVYLDALEALNKLQMNDRDCGDCRMLVSAAIWRLLPPASPEPQSLPKPSIGLGDSYLSQLGLEQ